MRLHSVTLRLESPTFPVSAVASLTDNFNVLAWYSFVAGAVGLVCLYVGSEAKFLSDLVERDASE